MWIASHYELGRRRRSVSTLALAVVGALLLAVITFAVVLLVKTLQSPTLPSDIAKKVDFVVLYPGSPWSVDEQTITYNDKANVLTLTAVNKENKLTISQQLTPSIFNDVPQYYPTLLDKLNQYDSFGTTNGTVYLTHPKELNGKTEAVLNFSGTLMFVAPNNEIPGKQWRQFFNNLSTVK